MKKLLLFKIKTLRQLLVALALFFIVLTVSWCNIYESPPEAHAEPWRGDTGTLTNIVNNTIFAMQNTYTVDFGMMQTYPLDAWHPVATLEHKANHVGQWSTKEVWIKLDDGTKCLIQPRGEDYAVADHFVMEFFNGGEFVSLLRSFMSFITYDVGWTYAYGVELNRGIKDREVHVVSYDIGADGGFDNIAEQVFLMIGYPNGRDYEDWCEPECDVSCGQVKGKCKKK